MARNQIEDHERKNVFIWERDEAVRIAINKAVEVAGYCSTPVASFDAMLEMVQDYHRNCLVLNWESASPDDRNLFPIADENKDLLPTIITTSAQTTDENKFSALDSVTSVLTKPFSLGEFVAAIDRAMLEA